MQKVDINPLLILSLNKSTIVTIIDILYFLNNHFTLVNIVRDNVIPIEGNFITIKNITCIIY